MHKLCQCISALFSGMNGVARLWHDELDRVTHTVQFGTYNEADFHRDGMSVPTRSANDTDGSDPWYYTCYNEKWQKITVFRGSDSHAKERYIHHAAGLDGMGSGSYIDDMVLRDWDKNSGWTSAADSTKEVRHYYLQNWRHDVVAVLTHDGKMVEQVKYLSYGTPIGLPAGDGDCDGDWDANDAAVISAWTTGYDFRYDANLDGVIDGDDITYANSIVGGGGYHTMGLGILSSPAVFNRQGYAGYEHAPELAGTKYHVRHRVLDSELGRWTRRDPLGYVDGMSVYEYVSAHAIQLVDPMGLLASACGGAGCPLYIVESSGFPLRSESLAEAIGPVATNSLVDGINKCLTRQTMCLKYRCMELLYDSFNQLCGGCMSGQIERLKGLIDLWCRRGDPSKATADFCTGQYKVMKPFCDSCGACRVPGDRQPTPAECRSAQTSFACWQVCIGWYQWYDAICPQGSGKKIDPNKHAPKIKSMTDARNRCGKVVARCQLIGIE